MDSKQQAAADFAPGTMVGEYEIEGELGRGGMGAVYSAIHPVIAKRAAIKVLHRELSMNTEAVERFVQEARSVNQIGHPNIVDIFAFGELPDGRNYFVMEWLRGESLRDRVRRGPLSLADAAAILETMTIALEAAHEAGVVHRDLKPDNVFLVDMKGSRPQVKLLDFGIAKLIGGSTVQRTQTGNLLGTPAYISPEQARAQAVDHRTDIYALGAMMFELFTGELVFEADNAADMIAKHLFAPPRSATALNPDVPPNVDALITRMLAKEAADRPTLDEVRSELRASFGPVSQAMSVQIAARTPPQGVAIATLPTVATGSIATPSVVTVVPVPRSRAPMIALAVVAAAGVAVAAFFAFRREPPPPVAAPVVTEPKVVATPPPPPAPAPAPAPTPAAAAAAVAADVPVTPTKPVHAPIAHKAHPTTAPKPTTHTEVTPPPATGSAATGSNAPCDSFTSRYGC